MFHRLLSTKLGSVVLAAILVMIIVINVAATDDISVEARSADYHLTVNKIVNAQIKSMMYFFDEYSVIDDLTPELYDYLVAPELIDLPSKCCNYIPSAEEVEQDPRVMPHNVQCGTDQFSHYEDDDELPLKMNITGTCLAYKINLEYKDFSNKLKIAADISSDDLEGSSITDVFRLAGVDENFIFNQKQEAIDLRSQTVRFYSQLFMSYPLHKQYELTLERLNDLKSNLKKIRRELRKYPSKFHNATSSSS